LILCDRGRKLEPFIAEKAVF